MSEQTAEEAAEELRVRLLAYRATKYAAAWLRERLEEERDRQFWPGARMRSDFPAPPDPQLRLAASSVSSRPEPTT